MSSVLARLTSIWDEIQFLIVFVAMSGFVVLMAVAFLKADAATWLVRAVQGVLVAAVALAAYLVMRRRALRRGGSWPRPTGLRNRAMGILATAFCGGILFGFAGPVAQAFASTGDPAVYQQAQECGEQASANCYRTQAATVSLTGSSSTVMGKLTSLGIRVTFADGFTRAVDVDPSHTSRRIANGTVVIGQRWEGRVPVVSIATDQLRTSDYPRVGPDISKLEVGALALLICGGLCVFGVLLFTGAVRGTN